MLAPCRAASSPAATRMRAGRAVSCRKMVICVAHMPQSSNYLIQRCSIAMLSAALASNVVLPAAVAANVPEPEAKSFGAERTSQLIQQGGTPEAVRPDTMKTNVPFQAPGINNPPRGAAQEQGTNARQVFRNVKKQIKEQNPDPDSAPLGIGKGPLVRNGKKMRSQPGDLGNLNKAAANRFKKMSADTAATQATEQDPAKPEKKGYINGSFTTLWGGRKQ